MKNQHKIMKFLVKGFLILLAIGVFMKVLPEVLLIGLLVIIVRVIKYKKINKDVLIGGFMTINDWIVKRLKNIIKRRDERADKVEDL